jgi:membrane protein HdeD
MQGKRAMIIEITNIVAGLILAMGVLPSIPAVGKSLEKVAKWLGRFQTVIGIIAIILGILYFGLQGIVAIVAGFVLAAGIMTSIPAIGKDLAKVAKWLGGFQTIIGIIAIILGIWGLLF